MSDISELTVFVERRAGEYLRAVGEYDSIETDLHYIRDDLDETEIVERLEHIHDHITWSWSPQNDALDAELGPKTASVQIRREAVIIHFPISGDRGVLIGLEPGAATDLTTFIGNCLEYIQDVQADAR
jgi:hypothetical protein